MPIIWVGQLKRANEIHMAFDQTIEHGRIHQFPRFLQLLR